MTTNQQADRLAEEALKLALKLRTPVTFHTQVSREWEEYATVERKRLPSHDDLYMADLLDRLATLARTPSVPDDVAIPVSIAGKMRPHVRADFDSDANFEAAAAARASHEGEQP